MGTGKPAGIVGKGIDVLRREGVAEFLKRSLWHVLHPVFSVSTYNVYEIHLKQEVTEVKPKAEGYSLAIADSIDQVERLVAEGIDFTTDPDFGAYGTGFDSGAFLFLVSVGGRLAHTSWVSLRHDGAVFDALFREIDFGEAGYIGPCNTFEQFRGSGLYPYALTNIFRFLMERGIRRAVISTRNTNNASIRGIVKAGFMPFRTVRKYKLITRSFLVKGGSFA